MSRLSDVSNHDRNAAEQWRTIAQAMPVPHRIAMTATNASSSRMAEFPRILVASKFKGYTLAAERASPEARR